MWPFIYAETYKEVYRYYICGANLCHILFFMDRGGSPYAQQWHQRMHSSASKMAAQSGEGRDSRYAFIPATQMVVAVRALALVPPSG